MYYYYLFFAYNAVQFSPLCQGQSMTLRKQQCSLDGQRSSQDVGASEESNLLQFFNPYVARDLTCVLLKAFLDESKCSHYNWNCGCLHFLHFCYLNFKIFVFGELLYFFNRYISFRWYTHVNHNARLFFLVFDNYVRSVSFYLFVCVHRHVP